MLGWAGVKKLLPSDQSDSEESSTTNASLSLSLLLEGTAGVETKIDSSI